MGGRKAAQLSTPRGRNHEGRSGAEAIDLQARVVMRARIDDSSTLFLSGRRRVQGDAARRKVYNEVGANRAEGIMSTLALGLVIVFGIATCTFYVAGDAYAHGSPWARDVCSLSEDLCSHPLWAATATGVTTVLYLVLKAMRL